MNADTHYRMTLEDAVSLVVLLLLLSGPAWMPRALDVMASWAEALSRWNNG